MARIAVQKWTRQGGSLASYFELLTYLRVISHARVMRANMPTETGKLCAQHWMRWAGIQIKALKDIQT